MIHSQVIDKNTGRMVAWTEEEGVKTEYIHRPEMGISNFLIIEYNHDGEKVHGVPTDEPADIPSEVSEEFESLGMEELGKEARKKSPMFDDG